MVEEPAGDTPEAGAADDGAAVTSERAEDSSSGSGTAPALQLDPAQLEPRDIIRTGSVAIEADDPEDVRDRIGDLVDSLGGYVSDESARTRPEGGVDELRIVIQVPTDRFEDAVEKVSALGEVQSRSVQAQDVTREVADVDSRVESARAALERVRALLDRAVSLGSVIRLEGVLSQRQSDLESLLAQQQALAGQTALGTLEVEVSAPDRAVGPADDDTDEATGFTAGLDAGWDALEHGIRAVEHGGRCGAPLRRNRRAAGAAGADLAPAQRARRQPVPAGGAVGAGNGAAVSPCTSSTMRVSTSGSVPGSTPCPRLNTCPGAAAPARSTSRTAASTTGHGAIVTAGSRLPCSARSRPTRNVASASGTRQSTPTTSAPAWPIAASSSPVPTPKWIRGTPRSETAASTAAECGWT